MAGIEKRERSDATSRAIPLLLAAIGACNPPAQQLRPEACIVDPHDPEAIARRVLGQCDGVLGRGLSMIAFGKSGDHFLTSVVTTPIENPLIRCELKYDARNPKHIRVEATDGRGRNLGTVVITSDLSYLLACETPPAAPDYQRCELVDAPSDPYLERIVAAIRDTFRSRYRHAE